DSCPVKEEIYKVALRHRIPVFVVSNSFINIPGNSLFQSVVVSSDFDAADDHIVNQTDACSVVISADILLAERCLKLGGKVIAPNGNLFTENSIGTAVATRAILEDLRANGEQHGSRNAPFSKKDRSQFLSSLHETLVILKRTS
ncbi:UNVERIFIED_CONTAM: hypothetical protein GTU68_048005, partial [Idotea baltica]|nr:hypothetical protein [Idotea baltica]